MMEDKKVISIRFHMDNKEDRELYEWLELEAGTSSSLASVVKTKIKDSYKKMGGNELNTGLQDKLVAVVREEMQESGMKLVGAILSGMAGGNGGTVIVSQSTVDIVEKENLPEKSEELPIGALDFLE